MFSQTFHELSSILKILHSNSSNDLMTLLQYGTYLPELVRSHKWIDADHAYMFVLEKLYFEQLTISMDSWRYDAAYRCWRKAFDYVVIACWADGATTGVLSNGEVRESSTRKT